MSHIIKRKRVYPSNIHAQHKINPQTLGARLVQTKLPFISAFRVFDIMQLESA